MGIFTSDKLFTEKDMRYEKFQNSKVMKELKKNPKISEALDKKLEQKEFYEYLKKKAPGGVTRNEMREILYELRYENKGGGIDAISSDEARQIAEAIFPGKFIERYRRPKRALQETPPQRFSRYRRPKSDSRKPLSSGSVAASRPSSPSPKVFPTRPRF